MDVGAGAFIETVRRLCLVAVGLASFGCASAPSPTRPELAAPTRIALAPPDVGPTVGEPAPDATTQPAEAAAPADAPTPPTDDEVIDLEEWLTERGVGAAERKKLPYIYMSCKARRIGDAEDEALDCSAQDLAERGVGADHVYRMRIRRAMYVVRAQRVHVALDLVETVTILDKLDLEQPDIVDLEVQLAQDGMSARLVDRVALEEGLSPLRSCDSALAELDARIRSADASSWDHFDRHLAKQACAARGPYVWKGTRFVRTATP